MTPSFSIFSLVFEIARTFGRTFDRLPERSAGYPFYYIGESHLMNDVNNDVMGNLRQTVHVWARREQRKEADKMASALINELNTVRNVKGYNVRLLDFNQQLIPSVDVENDLLHLVIDFNFKYTKRSA